MLEWILLGMVVDTVRTINNEAKEKEIQKKRDALRHRLRTSMTFGHQVNCDCRLCENRRQDVKDRLEDLK